MYKSKAGTMCTCVASELFVSLLSRIFMADLTGRRVCCFLFWHLDMLAR